MTSNPSIFDKAISGSSDYDDAIKDLHAKGRDLDSIYEGLVLEDIASAADLSTALFRAIHPPKAATLSAMLAFS